MTAFGLGEIVLLFLVGQDRFLLAEITAIHAFGRKGDSVADEINLVLGWASLIEST